jgi:hypothetical protein
VVTVASELDAVDRVDDSGACGAPDVADVDGAAEVADVDGAVMLGGGCAMAAVFCTGPGSNRQTAMNPAIDSATTKMVFFTTSP